MLMTFDVVAGDAQVIVLQGEGKVERWENEYKHMNDYNKLNQNVTNPFFKSCLKFAFDKSITASS